MDMKQDVSTTHSPCLNYHGNRVENGFLRLDNPWIILSFGKKMLSGGMLL